MISKNTLASFFIKPQLAEQLRSLLQSVVSTRAPAVLIRDKSDRAVVGVVVTPAEYELLKATYDLVKSSDGPAKIAGTYRYGERIPEALTLEDALSSRYRQ
jgi:hypothetical protein